MNYTNKRNTYNVEDIEAIAIDYLDPEVLLIQKQCELSIRRQEQELIQRIKEFDILDKVDLLVLQGEISREDAAEILDLSYDAYRSRLYRRVAEVKEQIDRNA